jgi:hypothetical protein
MRPYGFYTNIRYKFLVYDSGAIATRCCAVPDTACPPRSKLSPMAAWLSRPSRMQQCVNGKYAVSTAAMFMARMLFVVVQRNNTHGAAASQCFHSDMANIRTINLCAYLQEAGNNEGKFSKRHQAVAARFATHPHLNSPPDSVPQAAGATPGRGAPPYLYLPTVPPLGQFSHGVTTSRGSTEGPQVRNAACALRAATI